MHKQKDELTDLLKKEESELSYVRLGKRQYNAMKAETTRAEEREVRAMAEQQKQAQQCQ